MRQDIPGIAEETLGGVTAFVSRSHRFGTDAVLLSDFALPEGAHMPSLACDLGSGCGIIPLLWFGRGCAPKQVYAVEIQPEGVELMRMSSEKNGLSGCFLPLCADMTALTAAQLPLGRFELVTCNPPYKADGAGIKSSEPSALTARHEGSCDIGSVCRAAARLLRFGGRFCLCLRPERLADAICAARENRLEPKRLRFVCQRDGEEPWLFLMEARRSGGVGLRVGPPLVIERDGGYSDELRRIYRQLYAESAASNRNPQQR